MADNENKNGGKLNGHSTPKIFASRLYSDIPISSSTGNLDHLSGKLTSEFTTSVRTKIPSEAHTAPYLGLEREGNAAVISSDGLILTVGYLLLESRTIQVMTKEGQWDDADYVAYDFESGFGLARARNPLGLTPISFGDSTLLEPGTEMIAAANAGKHHWIEVKVSDRREFAGYWEYFIGNAIFTTPAHPNWSGTPLVGSDGLLYGIGSLLVEDAGRIPELEQGNMFIPVELLKPILGALVETGRSAKPVRPRLGMFTAETQTGLAIVHVTPGGPAQRSGLELEDVILRVDGEPINNLAHMYQKIWGLGEAGTIIPLTVMRDTVGVEITVKSGNRYDYFVTPRE